MAVNLVQSSDIETFFLQQAEGDAQIAQWLEMALTKSLRRRPESAVELTDLPPDAPGWLIYKWANGGPFHRFSPDPELINKVGHIRDWLVEARDDDAPFLKRKDEFGNPLKLHNLDLEAAFNAASKYFDRKSHRAVEVSDCDEETVKTFPDGFRIVELLTPQALEGEGKKMRHCIGSGAYIRRLAGKEMRFYSLRGADGEPLVTLSVRDNGELDQCKAWRDGQVAPGSLPYLISFLTERRVSLRRFHLDLPGLFQDSGGTVMPLSQMPPSYTMRQTMVVTHDASLEGLPDKLFVEGRVHLRDCPNLSRLGAELTVTRDLVVEECPQLQELPHGLIVGYRLRIWNCGLRTVPGDVDVGWDLQLQDCRLLSSLSPDLRVRGNLQIVDCDNIVYQRTVRVGGWFDIESKNLQRLQDRLSVRGCFSLQNCDALTTIGDGLTVTGSVHLSACPNLKSLPKGMHVEGNLTIDNCGIESLPDDLFVGGALKIRNCPDFKDAGSCAQVRGPFEFRDCARLEQLPQFSGGQELGIFGCTALGPVLPEHLTSVRRLRTDLFIDPEALNG